MKENDERKFLHDIASPLATAIFLLDAVMDSHQERPDASEREITHTKQLIALMDRIKKMIEERRATLIRQTDSGSKAA